MRSCGDDETEETELQWSVLLIAAGPDMFHGKRCATLHFHVPRVPLTLVPKWAQAICPIHALKQTQLHLNMHRQSKPVATLYEGAA